MLLYEQKRKRISGRGKIHPSLLLKRLFFKAIFQDQDALIQLLNRQIKVWVESKPEDDGRLQRKLQGRVRTDLSAGFRELVDL